MGKQINYADFLSGIYSKAATIIVQIKVSSAEIIVILIRSSSRGIDMIKYYRQH